MTFVVSLQQKQAREVQLKCTFSDFKFSFLSILERTIRDITVVVYKIVDNFIPNHEQVFIKFKTGTFA